MTKQVVDVLRRARQLIEWYGWIQGSYGTKRCGFCAIGAIDTAQYELDADTDDALIAVYREAGGSVIPYNDEPGRTKEEVLELFDRAIAAAEVRQ